MGVSYNRIRFSSLFPKFLELSLTSELGRHPKKQGAGALDDRNSERSLRGRICTPALDTSVFKFLRPRPPHAPDRRVRRAVRRLYLAHPTPSLPEGTEPGAPARPHRATRDSLLGRAPHRGPRLPSGLCLPALPHRGSGRARRGGPRLQRRLLRTACAGPRSRMGHRPPTHGAAAGGAAGVQPPPSDAAPLPSGRTAVAAAALLPAGFGGCTGRFRARHRRPPRGL